MFNFLRNFQKVHRSCITLHSHLQYMSVPISLHPCQTFVTICLFDYSQGSRYKEILHCGSVVNFPDDKWCWGPFHVLIGNLCTFFWEMSSQIFYPCLNWVICLFIVELWVLCIFWLKVHYQIHNLEIFPFYGLSFHFLNGVLWHLNFNLMKSILSISLFVLFLSF